MKNNRFMNVLLKAKEENIAVGAVNIFNYLTAEAAVKAAEEIGVNLIIQTSAGTVEHFGAQKLYDIVDAARKGAKIEVALHLDHCRNKELGKLCADTGWDSIMMDFSHLPFEENIANTREMAEYAHSRNVAIEGEIGVISGVEEEIVSGVENDPDIQQKSRTMQLLALTSAKKDILRVHSDIALPQSSPNIGHLLYDYVEVRNRQVICTGEQMQIQGEAYVNVLYSSPEGKMEWYETMVPFSESIEGGMTGTQPICWVHCQTKEYEVEPAEDYDGEMRALSLNLSMDVEMKLWEERNVELLADVYSLETNLVPQKEMVCAKKLLIKNEAKLRISEQMKLAEEQERILQLCSFEGHAEMDHVEPVENGLQVEGILTVDILYATTDDSFPIAHTQEQIPFTQIVDVPGMKGHTEDISYEIEPAIDQLAVNLLDNERFEVKAVISLQTIVQQEVCMEKIVDIHKEPLDAVELMKQPGIVGYIVKKEEQLWDIARHFHTTEAEIMETNGLKSADVQQGDKLLIVKKVSEC